MSKVLLTAVDNAARVSQLRVTFAFLILLVFVALTNRRSLPLHRRESDRSRPTASSAWR